jgi:hypothetical protein
MISRVWWIVVSYATRPSFLAWTGAGIFLLASGVIPLDDLLIAVMVPYVCFAHAIGTQLSSQFLGSNSRLVPRFVANHALVGIVLASCVIALGAARLITEGLTLTAAIAASAALVTTTIAQSVASAWTTKKVRLQETQRLTWIARVSFVCVTYVLTIATLSEHRRPFLLNSPIVVVGFSLVTCVASVLAGWTLAHLVEWSSGSSSLERRNRMSPAWLGTGGSSPLVFALSALATEKRERRIEALLPTATNSSWWRRVQRWRLGNPPSGFLRFMLVMLGVTFVLTLGRLGFTFVFLANLILLVMSGEVARIWRARLLVLPLEFLRPYSRRAIQRELAAAFALELFPIAVLFAIVQAIAINLEATVPVQWQSVVSSFLIFLTLGYSWILAGAALSVVEEIWVAIVLFPALLLANVFGVLVLLLLQPGHGDSLASYVTLEMVQTQLWLPVLTGAILCWILRRRWLKIEIGQRR